MSGFGPVGGRFQDQFAPTGTMDVLGICDDYKAIRINKNRQHYMCAAQRKEFHRSKSSISEYNTIYKQVIIKRRN